MRRPISALPAFLAKALLGIGLLTTHVIAQNPTGPDPGPYDYSDPFSGMWDLPWWVVILMLIGVPALFYYDTLGRTEEVKKWSRFVGCVFLTLAAIALAGALSSIFGWFH